MDKNDIIKAVALTYKKEERSAPDIVAKGAGKFAEQILLKAIQSKTPIYKNPDLLYELTKLNFLEDIPEYLYGAVAEILAYIYKIDELAGKQPQHIGAANA